MNKPLTRIFAAAALALAIGPALAADTYSSGPTDGLATARSHIAAGQWSAAIDELKKVNETGSADWNNLMGYAHRKAGTPDFVAAERYYDAALRIEPKHRGALEYSGELYLMTNNLTRAEQRLAALDKACFLPCEEFTLLKQAVERYKANGNKYVAR
jgi:HAMP domain-containing protein